MKRITKKMVEDVKKEAREKGMHPMKYWLETQGAETEADIYRENTFLNDANYFMDELYGVFECIEDPKEYKIFETDGLGYERNVGWILIKLFYNKEDALEWREKNIKRKKLWTLFDGTEIWNYDSGREWRGEKRR